jgi:hypothetical protein
LRQPGADCEQVEREYQDANARLVAAEYECIAWDHRTRIAPLRKEYEAAKLAARSSARRMARTMPTTAAGGGALISYICSDLKDDLDPRNWSTVALKTVAVSLSRMNKEAA